jgi:uncharacterized membrane protein
MDGPFFLPGWLWTLIFLALVGGLVYFLVRLSTSRRGGSASYLRDRFDSVEILKVRFAKGEISQEEYTMMKQSLEHP